jgi:hypothetical protein
MGLDEGKMSAEDRAKYDSLNSEASLLNAAATNAPDAGESEEKAVGAGEVGPW